ncbi:hypothetical protein [uncultured Serratia sp.]|uniref:hypothetical protein n=1 Tax=uncultured Serratia sp. TaxID=239175 RepID=UPI0025871221|nr:hypothetical protein [uncultured Serratia sp.]
MRKLIFIALLSAPALAETPHCVTATNEMFIVTQCDNGTVSVTNGRTGVAVICSSKEASDPRCEKVNTNKLNTGGADER